MLQKLKFPHTLQWVIRLFIMYLIIFTLFRLATYIAFNPDKDVLHGEQGSQYSAGKVIPAFLLGLLYDLRWISIILAPIVVASCIPAWTPFKNRRNKRLWSAYLVLVSFMVLFFFGADFGHFQYVRTRLNASALNFFEDAGISLRMLWESYPIFWIIFGLTIVILLVTWVINRSYFKVEEKNTDRSRFDYHRRWYLVTLLLMGFFVYGGFSMKPLSTHDSFRRMNDEFRGFLSLNPFQNFFTSLKFRNPGFKGNQVNEEKRQSLYPLVAGFLNPDSASLGRRLYTRHIPAHDTGAARMNVVLVLCESLSSYKSSMSGNPLNASPYLKQLSDSGLYFDRCFSPHFGTARGVFALLSGIPDVQMSKFSSRNKNAVEQRTIINDFTAHEKLYFIGGSSEFNNFRGLINNINGVKLFEEGSFKSEKYNVWGISDKNLLLEANQVFRSQTKPFFAVVQTADNHEPYTIPKEDIDFVRRTVPKDSLKHYGFHSLPEFHAFQYFDYCIQRFMEQAKQEAYFNNTLFVFIGDHGVIGDARALYPNSWTSHRLTEEHVPLVFYAPGRLQPQKRMEPVSQIDVLPTIAGLAGIAYTNTTLGRDLLDSAKKQHFAFTIFHDAGKTGIVSDSFYYVHNYNTGDDELLPLYGNDRVNRSIRKQRIAQYAPLADGIYETAKWMLVNNRKSK
jgi:phosphoglycerol transferase MdoB-like AlkP superfamily enzyme